MKSLLRGIPWKKIWPYDPSPGPSEFPFCFLTTWLSTGIPQILLQWLLKARRIHSSRIPHMPFLQLKYLLMLLSSPSAAAKVVSFLCYFWRDQTCSRKRSSLNLLHSSSVVWPALLLQFLFKWCHMKEDFLNIKSGSPNSSTPLPWSKFLHTAYIFVRLYLLSWMLLF